MSRNRPVAGSGSRQSRRNDPGRRAGFNVGGSDSKGGRRLNRDAELEDALQRPSSFRAWHVSEPHILVGDAQPSPDPKLGLSMFGPWRTNDDPGQGQIRVGIVGTGETINAAQHWLTRCRSRVDPAVGDDADPYLYPSFPGMETDDGFRCRLDLPQSLTERLSETEVARCVKATSRDAAVEAIGRTLREHLQALAERESPPQVVLVALPQEVRDVAGGGRHRVRKRPQREQRQLTLSFMDPRPLEPFSPSRTLHRVVKAEGMRANLPTQLIWPGSLEGSNQVQDDATRAWNLCTALYYKAGGIPWRVNGLARNTCYVGISFFQPIDGIGELQASMAQAFSDRTEGTVLRGTRFSWDRKKGAPKLSRSAARDLLDDVLHQYELHHHQKPARVVVHKSSAFSEDEIAGLEDALGGVSYYDFLSVAPSSIRFLRAGKEPPIRGTAIQIGPRRYVMYTRGYVPYLQLYPGLRIPRPMQFTHARGSAGIQELMREVLALTRMNWNSADFAAAEPITLAFSRNVGLILSELPTDIEPRNSFRFYM